MAKDAVRSGSSVVEIGFLLDHELEWGKWYRSRERKTGLSPFGSYMLNKKWTKEEQFNNHMLRFQQVTVHSSNYFFRVHFNISGWIDDECSWFQTKT